MPTSFDVLLKNWLTKISNSIKGISVSGDTLTVTKTDNSTEDLTLGLQALEKKIFAQSTWYKRPQLMTTGTGGVAKREILIHKGTQVAINNNLYVSTQDVILDTSVQIPGASNRAGKDVYVYACVPTSGTEPVFVLSLNSTVPTGYTADTSRKIGGFHCLCADVGTIEGHTLSGYVAGDILPLSVWDLLFRAESDNEGMIYFNGIWVDIYLPRHTGDKFISAYDVYFLRNTTGERFSELAAKSSKRLISRDEFAAVAKGSNEMTNISGSVGQNGTGGHVDTANRRMVSDYGLEDCCGFYYQWTRDIWGAANSTNHTSYVNQYNINPTAQTAATPDTPAVSGSHRVDGATLQTDGRGTYNVAEDGGDALNKYGLASGSLMRAFVGGRYDDGDKCGSRNVVLSQLSSIRFGDHSARLVSVPRVVNL